MKRKNKKIKLMLKKRFTKDQLLVMKKYDKLLVYDIPYAIINRAYKRYIGSVDDYVLKHGYPNHWFSKTKESFCNAVKTYIVSKQEGYKYNFGTRGFVSMEIVKLSGIDLYLHLEGV